jgi:hypothetical protein
VSVRTPDAARCRALLGGMVERTDGDHLLVRAADPASLNAYLVGEQVRVSEIGPHRRDLEGLVLEAGAAPVDPVAPAGVEALQRAAS